MIPADTARCCTLLLRHSDCVRHFYAVIICYQASYSRREHRAGCKQTRFGLTICTIIHIQRSIKSLSLALDLFLDKYIDIVISQNTTQFYAQYVQYISQLHISAHFRSSSGCSFSLASVVA